ncbi:MAG: hypothetical protein DMF69_06435 [Acidobacteria bacterium]|nr:MAG: hypothetical protein DMF69_06435 [Acidobacteriota bacterium]
MPVRTESKKSVVYGSALKSKYHLRERPRQNLNLPWAFSLVLFRMISWIAFLRAQQLIHEKHTK